MAVHAGAAISGAGHLALILWLMIGSALTPRVEETLEATEVTLLSAEEFAALLPQEQPEPDAPEPAEGAPESTTPEVSDIAQPLETSPDEDTQLAVTPPEADRPRAAPRVAPEPSAEPAPEAVPDIETTPEVSLDAPGETQPEADATAPEAATTRTVPNATPDGQETLAPQASTRPRGRPDRPEAPETATAEAPPSETAVEDAVAAAVAEALEAPAPTGPPMTGAERDALRISVQRCWNVGSLSSDALRVTVTLLVEMTPDGKPDNGSIRLLEASGGSDGAVTQAFEAARRAVIRCGAQGFDLPLDKYDQWREIEMVFNPERMRIR